MGNESCIYLFSNDINRSSINFVLISLENKVIKSTVLHTTFFVFRESYMSNNDD